MTRDEAIIQGMLELGYSRSDIDKAIALCAVNMPVNAARGQEVLPPGTERGWIERFKTECANQQRVEDSYREAQAEQSQHNRLN